MDRYEKSIKALENIIEYWTYKPEEVEAARTAIECIKEHQERAKGCEYCNTKVMDGNPIFHSHSDGYIGKGKFCSAGTKAHFCPMCGRNLTKDSTQAFLDGEEAKEAL